MSSEDDVNDEGSDNHQVQGNTVAIKKTGRRPGRPPKKRLTDIQIQTHGIVETPVNPDAILELTYENPILFKKLLALMKKYDLNEITWDFHLDRIELLLQNEKGSCIIHTVLYGRMLVRYYCKERMSRSVKRENLDKIFKSMDKNYPKVSFIWREEDSRSKMYIILTNDEVDANLTYEADLIREPENKTITTVTDDDYPIKFKLPSKHFKKLIADIHAADSKKFTLKKNGTEPVSFTFEKVGKLSLAATYNNSSKIELDCKLDPDDLFSVTVPINHVKPFSDSNIGDFVNIAADKYKKFSIWSEVDKKKYTRADGSIVEGPVCKIQLFAAIEKVIDFPGFQ